jgi:DNA-binding PadR family transcriptional regulator
MHGFGKHRWKRHWRWGGEELIGTGGRFFGPGEVRLALLSLLQEGPSHGYGLIVRLEERSGGAYQPSAGTIYPMLQQLEDEGQVRSEVAEGRKVYHLTPSGVHEVEANAQNIGEIWSRMADRSEWGLVRHPAAIEVIGPATRLMKAALRAAVESRGRPEVARGIRDILERAREDIERLLKRRRE